VGAIAGGFIAEKILEMIRGEGPEAEAQGREDAGAGAGGGEAEAGAEGGADDSFTTEDVNQAFQQMKASYDAYRKLEDAGRYQEAAQMYENYMGLKRQVDGMRQTAYAARN
jgi:hypothetical protein